MRRQALAVLFLLFTFTACGDATGVSKHVEDVSRWMFKDRAGELSVFGPDPVTRLEVEKGAECDRISAHVEMLYGFPMLHEEWTCVWWG